MNKLKELKFVKDLQKLNAKIYIVGGFVRNHLLCLEPNDIDLLVEGLTIEQIEPVLEENGQVDYVGKSFGVFKFKCSEDNTEYEIAVPRTEVKTGPRHTDFQVETGLEITLDMDLYRRDFTINSMALDLDGNLHDPYNGKEDLQNKVLKMTNADAFIEDPLRSSRGVRFCAKYDFTYESETEVLMTDTFENGLHNIPYERLANEFFKMLKESSPANILKAVTPFKGTDFFKHTYDQVPVGIYDIMYDNECDNSDMVPEMTQLIMGMICTLNFPFDIESYTSYNYELYNALYRMVSEINWYHRDKRGLTAVHVNSIFTNTVLYKHIYQNNEDKIEDFMNIYLKALKELNVEHYNVVSRSYSNFLKGILPMSASDLKISGNYIKDKVDKPVKIGKILNHLFQLTISETINNTEKDLKITADQLIKQYVAN